MELFGIMFLIVLTIVVGIMASKRNRCTFGWVILSFFISPLLCIILLWALGVKIKR